MKLAKGSIPHMGHTAKGYEDTGGSYRLHFPDGNATIARLLVRNLIPSAVPGTGVDNLVTARVNYAELDRPAAAVRLRLSSIVTRARHLGSKESAKQVEVTYLRGGKPFTARAGGVVLACYNMMIPYLCPELPDSQKEALHKLVKTPLVYTSVALRNWEAFDKLKIYGVYAPGGYHTYFHLNPHVTIGGYQGSNSPQDPVLVHMVRTPCKAGCRNMIKIVPVAPTFWHLVRNLRAQYSRPARAHLEGWRLRSGRDITAITVNRWPHGYAPEFNPLFDPDVPEEQQPHVWAAHVSAGLPSRTPTRAAPHTRTRPSIKGIAQ
jgi:spermidine dehydrogenase